VSHKVLPTLRWQLAAALLWGAAGCSQAGVDAVATNTTSALRPGPSASWLDVAWDLPSDTVIWNGLLSALTIKTRQDNSRIHDAKDVGELGIETRVPQSVIDQGLLGPDALFFIGDEIFELEFRPDMGLGNGLNGFAPAGTRESPNLRRVHRDEFGGPDAYSCSGCHSQGGLNGAGAVTQNVFFRGDGEHMAGADERNPPHVLGLGPVVALAREMTRALQSQRAAAVQRARLTGEDVTVALSTKGVSFGTLTAHANGQVNARQVEGVDPDLVVKPLGWKGHQARLEDFVEESLRVHMGVVTTHLGVQVLNGVADPNVVGNGQYFDPDKDGVEIEMTDGQVTALAFYLSQLEVPVIRPPTQPSLLDRFARGRVLMDQVGCTACHVAEMELLDPVLPIQPPGRDDTQGPPAHVNVALDGELPKMEPRGPQEDFGYRVALFSDLKRHDMGAALATPTPQGTIPESVFLTRSLWGVADTPPYLHDGRAPTLDAAIRAHDGESQQSRTQYEQLDEGDRQSLQVFLLSLTRRPRMFVP
jgi:hypothetical protein